MIAVAGNDVASKDVEAAGVGEFQKIMAGLSHSQLMEALNSAPRDPVVEQFRDLRPEARVRRARNL